MDIMKKNENSQKNLEYIINILSDDVKRKVMHYIYKYNIEEIRLRVGKPIIVYGNNKEFILDYMCKKDDLKIILQRMSNYSIYAFEEEIKKGYITVKGGHRIGLCGNCVLERDKVKTIKHISSINIRICKEIIGCSNKIINCISKGDEIFNTIIISPPKCGKTTLIRDLARNISNGTQNIKGKKVCIIDERSEIGGSFQGVPQMDVGIRTDVLDNCLKSEGIIMAIRSMAPEVIICDEIGTVKDVESIIAALNSGISLITTIHGENIDDLLNRVVFEDLVENFVFKRAVILSNKNGPGTIEYIYDFNKNCILEDAK